VVVREETLNLQELPARLFSRRTEYVNLAMTARYKGLEGKGEEEQAIKR
jgi:hypothetical protein